MSDSDSMSYDFSSQWTVDTILPPQEEDPENNDGYRRKWFKMAVVMLIVAVVFNIVVGVGLHAGISYIERQILEKQQRAVLAQTTVTTSYERRKTSDDDLPTTMPSKEWTTGMTTYKLLTELENRDVVAESNRHGKIIGWDGPDVSDGVKLLINKREFNITSIQPIVQIYSHLTFKAGTERGRSEFNQTIWRESKGTHNLLIVDSQIKNCTYVKKDDDLCYTSIIFSALRLHKGDRIYVTTSHNINIIRNSNCTFFGIYELK